jgi:segregation and condensation protein A
MTEPSGAEYTVRLPAFEGPLDLLLHLIRVNEMDIFDIPIVEITRQYQAHLELMERLNLDLAGEFLLMAATLMHIKSKMLLPRDVEPGEGASEDPRTELTRQLVEHQRLKQAAENLQALDSIRGLVWNRGASAFPEFEGEELLVVDLFAVLSAMKKILDRVSARERLALRTEEFSVTEKVDWLESLLAGGGSVSLLTLARSMRSAGEVIATFLAILELLRSRKVLAIQRVALDDILLAAAPASPPDPPGEPEIASPLTPPGTPPVPPPFAKEPAS